MVITSGTYTVRFTGPRHSPKRFRDMVKYAKDAGGSFDSASKTWTVTITQPEPQTNQCGACDNGEPRYSWSRAANGACNRCGGTLKITSTPPARGATQLRILADSYGALVERVS